MTPLVHAVNVLRKLDAETRRLAIMLSKPDAQPRRKKPGPKPGTKRLTKREPATPTPPKTTKSRRIEPEEAEAL